MRITRMKRLASLQKMAQRTNILRLSLLLTQLIRNLQRNRSWKMINALRFKSLRMRTVFIRKKTES